MLRKIIDRLSRRLGRRDPAKGERLQADLHQDGPAPESSFSREQREAIRRHEGGDVGLKGTHGGEPGDTRKDPEARGHD
jgi:hypothetical protein